MNIRRLNLRNVAKIGVTCLAVCIMTVACEKKNNSNGNNDDPNGNGNGNGGDTKVGLTVENLPNRPGQAYDVEVFPDDVVTTRSERMSAILYGQATARASVSAQDNSNVFTLLVWDGKSGNNTNNPFKGTGTFTVILFDVNKEATTFFLVLHKVPLTNGIGKVNFNDLEDLPLF